MIVDEALVKDGIQEWSRCQLCHGPGAVAGGTAPDLRASTIPLNAALFSLTVRTGIEAKGMPKFTELTDHELDALRNYIRYRARLATRPNGVAPPPPEAPPAGKKPEEPVPEQKPAGSLESTGITAAAVSAAMAPRRTPATVAEVQRQDGVHHRRLERHRPRAGARASRPPA